MNRYPFNLGISPINWSNEDVKELGEHYTSSTILSEMKSLGFVGTEMHSKFPSDASELKNVLSEKGMQLVSQWKGVLFADKSKHESELEAYKKHVLFLKSMGCKVVVTCELGGSTIGDPRRDSNVANVKPLTDKEWKNMVEGLEKAGQICKENGMTLVYHHHMGTNVENPEEIDRLMETTDPDLVSLTFDSGHAYYGGADPYEVLVKHYDRIKHIHFKDIRQDVLDEVKKGKISFKHSIAKNVFTVPGDGIIDFKPIFEYLLKQNYTGWAILEAEQDPAVKNPVEYAQKSKDYIQNTFNELNNKQNV
ncbi:myo-inosose-2 dehydratase [Chengkuizengella axinellae]|uniref:Myo-inosose-2 dehydratase n=1 Tax=Chengkuizengella axinellae TaxID=3064388 RepID=A0ABT9IY63_9BACL|nr:myo-inosose-2 dehydratase [Chengkuizengella sp. 2205SS18-9]MDP5274067.1 myo-inosose-2 dehydratase [Chengkuizengella sp. 2205SS18-9]